MDRAEIAAVLRGLELHGLNVLVHASLASFGIAEGGAGTVCELLCEAVGPSGTIVMPAFTFRETLFGVAPAPVPFHADLPASGEIDAIAETFRRLPGVLRSTHPTHSFTARGPRAMQVLSTQRDNNTLGPVKKLNVMQGHVLLLGTSLRAATAIHLAEETGGRPFLGRGTASRINLAGFRERVVVEQIPGCSRAFDRLEERLAPAREASLPLVRGEARRFNLRRLVRLASAALVEDPHLFLCGDDACAGCAIKRLALEKPSARDQ
jgi:aminoglycoside 3-N-acetyltransferase